MKISSRSIAVFVMTASLTSVAFADETSPAGHRFMAQDKGHVAIVNAKGEVEWEAECKHTSHDMQLLPNGNYLLNTGPAKVTEMTPEKKVVWEYESTPTPENKQHVEVHAFQRLENGDTMISESGNARIIEVDKSGKIVKQFPLTVEHPSAHSDTRLVRKLENGHYLVAHENDGCVREYDDNGKVVWTYKIGLNDRSASGGHGVEGHGDHVYSAVRLAGGNTLIGCGNGNRVIEVTPEGKVVWSVEQKELPGITLAWVMMVQVLPNGNILISNCHAGPTNPQLIEVTRDKKVVWSMNDQKNFGNSTAASMLLDVNGKVLR